MVPVTIEGVVENVSEKTTKTGRVYGWVQVRVTDPKGFKTDAFIKAFTQIKQNNIRISSD